MKDVQLYRVKGKKGFASTTFENSEECIFEMAAKGYSCVGYVPIRVEGYGMITEYDLIFVKVE